MKNRWTKVRIKMQLINSMRESIFKGLRDDPINLFYAKQQLIKLEENLDSFNSDLTKFINKYSEYLPNLKTTEQVCDNCKSNQVVQYEDVFVCQECSATHSFVNDNIVKIEDSKTVDNSIRVIVKKFRERIREKDIFSEKLVRDYQNFVLKAREGSEGKVPNKDFCLLCILLRNKQQVPSDLSIPKGDISLFPAIVECKNIFEKLGWIFPSEQVKEYVTKKKMSKIKDSLERVL